MQDKKKLLVYAHYFYPDVASTAQILTELLEGLEKDFEITVICVVPSYNGILEDKYKNDRYFIENYKTMKVIRVRVPEFDKGNKKSRILNILTYFIRAIRATRKIGNQDYIYTISQPPILGGLLGIIGKKLKKAKLIYNIQDFNPEQTAAVGYSKNKMILNLMLSIDKYSCKKADKIILVGRDMKETLSKRFNYRNVPRNVVINNWIDEKQIVPLKVDDININSLRQQYNLENKFIIMYSGNLGLYYDLENLIKVIERFKERNDILFLFVGDGSVKKDIEKYAYEHRMENVKFLPYQPKEKLNYSLNLADVHWVVSAKGIKGVSVPSKLYGVMSAGKPVLGVLEKESEARLIVEEADCGICVEPGMYEDIDKAVEYVINNRDIIQEMGLKGRAYLERNLKKEISINKYKEEILSI